MCHSSVHSTTKDYFIIQKPNTTLSLPGIYFLLYNVLLAIKEAKLKDMKDLANTNMFFLIIYGITLISDQLMIPYINKMKVLMTTD